MTDHKNSLQESNRGTIIPSFQVLFKQFTGKVTDTEAYILAYSYLDLVPYSQVVQPSYQSQKVFKYRYKESQMEGVVQVWAEKSSFEVRFEDLSSFQAYSFFAYLKYFNSYPENQAYILNIIILKVIVIIRLVPAFLCIPSISTIRQKESTSIKAVTRVVFVNFDLGQKAIVDNLIVLYLPGINLRFGQQYPPFSTITNVNQPQKTLEFQYLVWVTKQVQVVQDLQALNCDSTHSIVRQSIFHPCLDSRNFIINFVDLQKYSLVQDEDYSEGYSYSNLEENHTPSLSPF